jgi:hypothetical protein
MNSKRCLKVLALAVCLLGFSTQVISADVQPNKKRGQVYFKMVCTVCHMQMAEKSIPPASRSMADWRAYFDANKHDVSGQSRPELTYYVSQEYRESIKDSNKAASKFLKLSDEQIAADVREFTVNGAKDSDTPASCN